MADKPDWMTVEQVVDFADDGPERRLHIVLDEDGARFMRAVMGSAVYEMELANAKDDAWKVRQAMVELFNLEPWLKGDA